MLNSLTRVSFLFLIVLLSACGEPPPPEPEEGARVDDHPATTAMMFFDAVYNKNDIDLAAKLSAPPLARIIRHYQTSSAIQRHVIGMQFDVDVRFKEDRDGKAYRETFANETRVTLKFKGTDKGEKKEDFRTIRLKKYKEKWRVEEVLADKFI